MLLYKNLRRGQLEWTKEGPPSPAAYITQQPIRCIQEAMEARPKGSSLPQRLLSPVTDIQTYTISGHGQWSFRATSQNCCLFVFLRKEGYIVGHGSPFSQLLHLRNSELGPEPLLFGTGRPDAKDDKACVNNDSILILSSLQQGTFLFYSHNTLVGQVWLRESEWRIVTQ